MSFVITANRLVIVNAVLKEKGAPAEPGFLNIYDRLKFVRLGLRRKSDLSTNLRPGAGFFNIQSSLKFVPK